MLSRFTCRAIQDAQKGLLARYHQSRALNTSASDNTNGVAESSKRDLVNYPDLVRPEYAPPVRYLVIPETWFQYFYPKTGVTGPYMFALGLGSTLFSKEIVVTHGVPHVGAIMILICVIYYKLGDKIAELHNKAFEEEKQNVDLFQDNKVNLLKQQIEDLKSSIEPAEGILEVMNAKKENVYLQMEALYRERILDVYKKVKKHLDFQVEMENVERRIVQKNLSDYVIGNVMKSITPELEKNVMQLCIKNLNNLAAKN